uniref:Uncharacterized protein n=1 Tax=Rhipicephalus zambeziensis TaxID=60191 RepID=A0A224YGN6_9ACAR
MENQVQPLSDHMRHLSQDDLVVMLYVEGWNTLASPTPRQQFSTSKAKLSVITHVLNVATQRLRVQEHLRSFPHLSVQPQVLVMRYSAFNVAIRKTIWDSAVLGCILNGLI